MWLLVVTFNRLRHYDVVFFEGVRMYSYICISKFGCVTQHADNNPGDFGSCLYNNRLLLFCPSSLLPRKVEFEWNLLLENDQSPNERNVSMWAMPGATTFISKNFGREEGIAFTITKRTSENKKAFKGSRKRTEKRWRGMKIIKNYRRIQISEMLHFTRRLCMQYACTKLVA